MPDVIKSLDNAYDHIQHEAYNDALSSILEARSKYILERSQPKVDELLERIKQLEDIISRARAKYRESAQPFDDGCVILMEAKIGDSDDL